MQVSEILNRFWAAFVELLPRVAGALIILGAGWVLGRLVGAAVSRFIRRTRIDRAFGRSPFGKALERSGVSLGFFFDTLARWVVYLGSILLAVDVLGFEALEPFLNAVVQYLPSLIGGALIFILGMVAVDFVADLASAAALEMRVELAGVLIAGLRLLLYFVVAMVALSMLKVDVSAFHIFASALAWGVAIGVGAGLGIALGWGFKDTIARNAERWISAARSTADRVEETVEAEALRARVKELESNLAEYEEKIEAMLRVRAALMEELTAPVVDLPSRLEELAGEKGSVSTVFGGYHISVLEPLTFPWFEILVTLTSRGFDIWLTREEEKLVIKCKAPTES